MNRKERRALAKKEKQLRRRYKRSGKAFKECSTSLTAQLMAMGPETHPEPSVVTASLLFQQEHEAIVRRDSSWDSRLQSYREDFSDDQIWVCTKCGTIAAFDLGQDDDS